MSHEKPIDRTNEELRPYPGPRPFQIEDWRYFHGREREIRDIVSLLSAYRLLLLYAQSGAGKSSLVAAGLRPRLEGAIRSEATPIPAKLRGLRIMIARVSGVASQELPAEEGSTNIYTYNVLSSLKCEGDEPVPRRGGTLHSHLPGSTTASAPVYGDGEEEDDQRLVPKDVPSLLILDQFEEILTFYPDRWRERAEFFKELGTLLNGRPRLRVLLVAREEYLATLESFGEHLPDGFRVRYRLDRLREEEALQAVVQPAERAVDLARKREDPDLAQIERACESMRSVAPDLVRNLQKSPLQSKDGKVVEFEGEFVEPLHLQVVCRDTWWRLLEPRPAKAQFSPQEIGDVDEVLSRFYVRAIERITGGNAARYLVKRIASRSPDVHKWVAEELITPVGTRSQVYLDAKSGRAAGLPEAYVDALEGEHIVRKELRAGTPWYELTHDRFVFAVQAVERARSQKRRRALTISAWSAAGIVMAVVVVTQTLEDKKTFAVPQEIQQLKVEKDRAVESATENARMGLKAHGQGDPLARDLFQQAQREDAWAGLMTLTQQLQRNDSPVVRGAYSAYMSSLEPYLVGDVVNQELKKYACGHSASVVGASERLDQAQDELQRFHRRGFQQAELSEPIGRYRRVYVERYVSCERARKLIAQVNSAFNTDAFVENAFQGICAGCPDLPQSLKTRRDPSPYAYSARGALQTLAGYKIGIYFDESDPRLKARAAELRDSLLKTGLQGVVALYPTSRSVLVSLAPAVANQVRYDAPAEEESSEALVELLRKADPGRTYSKLRTRSGTKSFISIFLAPDGAAY